MPRSDESPTATVVPLPLIETGKGRPAPARRASLFIRLQLWRIPLVMAVVFTGAVVGLYFQPPALRAFFNATGLAPGGGTSKPIAVPAQLPVPGAAPAPALRTGVVALGRLMPDGDSITLALPYGAGDARVARLLVAEGDTLAEGQVIAELDSLPQLAAQRASAEATLAARAAAVLQTRAGVQSSLAEARANRDRAASAAELATLDLARVADLAGRGVATRAQLETAQSNAEQTGRELDRTEAALARYTSAEGDAQPDIAVAERNLDVARADLARAEQDMARGIVRAPSAGTVLALHVAAGEKPGASGVATLGNIAQMRAELEVYQTDIRRVSLGQSVTLTASALAGPLTGSVDRIRLEVERQSIVAPDPAANTDARIVKVEVLIDPASSEIARRLTGLEVVGRISVEPAQ